MNFLRETVWFAISRVQFHAHSKCEIWVKNGRGCVWIVLPNLLPINVREMTLMTGFNYLSVLYSNNPALGAVIRFYQPKPAKPSLSEVCIVLGTTLKGFHWIRKVRSLDKVFTLSQRLEFEDIMYLIVYFIMFYFEDIYTRKIISYRY